MADILQGLFVALLVVASIGLLAALAVMGVLEWWDRRRSRLERERAVAAREAAERIRGLELSEGVAWVELFPELEAFEAAMSEALRVLEGRDVPRE